MINILERVPKILESPNAVDLDFKQGAIKFDNISFAHKIESKIKKEDSDEVQISTS